MRQLYVGDGEPEISSPDAVVVYSDSDGAGSSIAIVDGDGLGSPDFLLFGNMQYYGSIEAAVPGVTYGYSEDGFFGTSSTSITFTSALIATNVVEAIVCGGTGLPL